MTADAWDCADGGTPIDELPGLLERLARHWDTLGAPLSRIAAPGLSDDQIDAVMEPTGLVLTEELRLWWRWHNGVVDHPPAGQQTLSGMITAASWQLQSMEYCVRTSVEHSLVDVEEIIRLKTWLNISDRYIGVEYLAVDLAGPARVQAPVLYYTKDSPVKASTIVAPSLTHLVKLWVERLDAGTPTITWSGDEWSDADVPIAMLDEMRFG